MISKCFQALLAWLIILGGGDALAAEAIAPPFQLYVDARIVVADGFEFPKGKQVKASAHGRIVSLIKDSKSTSSMLTIEHFYFQNHKKHQVRSIYKNIAKPSVKLGDTVKRGDALGQRTAQFTFRIDSDLETKAFVQKHRQLFVPSAEPSLLLIHADTYQMRHYKKGKLKGEYEVAFGQAKGRKRVRGDNRTPRGMYFVTSKYRGEFTGKYGAYYGGHWIKVNYPNAYDAQWGLANKKLSSKTKRGIEAKWKQRKLTSQKTKLGGGIGFHGWIGPWSMKPDGAHLSWGCIVMHNEDIKKLFDQIPETTMVVIF